MAEIAETTIQKDTKLRVTGWHVLRVLIGLLLLISAGTKAHMLATQPILGEGFLQSRWLQIAIVEFELAFSVWLFAGLMPRVTGCVALACFAVFTIVSAGKWISGSESCGCFGAVRVFPAWTFLLDLTIIGLLIVFMPRGIVFQWKAFLSEMSELKQFKRVGIAVVVWMLLAVPMTRAMITVEFVTLTVELPLAKSEKNVVLKPFQWIDSEFPLLPYIDDATRKKLIIDRQNVVLFRFDCEECKLFIEKLANKNEYVFIAISNTENNLTAFSLPEYSILSDQHEWWVETPVFFELKNGIVRNVSSSLN